MLLVPVLAVVFHQVVAPTLPIGLNGEFQKSALAVSAALAKEDFDEAAKLAEKLPKLDVTVSWDDSAVPADKVASFRAQRDSVFDQITKKMPDYKLHVGDDGQIKITFSKEVTGGPKLEWGEKPRLNVVIPLDRGAALTSTDVANEVTHTAFYYVGLAESPVPFTALHRFDSTTTMVYPTPTSEYNRARQAMYLTEALRNAPAAKRKIVIKASHARLLSQTIDLGEVRQGEIIPFSVKLENTGEGAVSYRIEPDCGCFRRPDPGEITSGQKRDVQIEMSTVDYRGLIHKQLMVYTNDFDDPIQVVPVTVKINPAYRFFRPEGENVILPDGGGFFDLYLFFPKGGEMTLGQTQIDGLPGKVKVFPWEGMLADPDLGEKALPRKGYKVRVALADALPPGRSGATISIATNSAEFPVVRCNINAQKGIVALPDSIYLGQLGSQTTKASFLLSAPGKPFRVLSVDTQNSHLKATPSLIASGDEYRIELVYDGAGPIGDFVAEVLIKTNDPQQPVIRVPVSGNVAK